MASLFDVLFLLMHTEYQRYSCGQTHTPKLIGVSVVILTLGAECTFITSSHMQLVKKKMVSKRETDPECFGFEQVFVSLPKCVRSHYPVLRLFSTEITFFTCSDRKREAAKERKQPVLLWGISGVVKSMRNNYLY